MKDHEFLKEIADDVERDNEGSKTADLIPVFEIDAPDRLRRIAARLDAMERQNNFLIGFASTHPPFNEMEPDGVREYLKGTEYEVPNAEGGAA